MLKTADERLRSPASAGILTSPRYTGRQVWNRQRKDEVLLDVHDVALGHTTKMRWNDEEKWIFSEEILHPPIIDDATFQKAQDLLTARREARGPHKPHKSRHAYVLRGLLFCAICQRRMQGHWANAAPYYRCRFPSECAIANRVQHPLNVTLRQDVLLGPLDEWLASKFEPPHLPATIDELAAASKPDQADTGDDEIKTKIDDCDRKLTQYPAALDAGAEPATVAQWITRTEAERARYQAARRAAPQPQAKPMSPEKIAAIVRDLAYLITVIRNADPTDKAKIYTRLGLRLTYQPGEEPGTGTVRTEVHVSPASIGNSRVSEGGLEPLAYILQSPDDAWLDVRGSA